MEMYAAVLGVLAVLLVPTVFYLWLDRIVGKELETPYGHVARSVAHDRRSELKQARHSLRRLIESRHLG
jgi:hypothetical protein